MDAQRIEETVEALGFEVVSLERGGGRRRPLIRIRIDRPDSTPGGPGVSVDDCARVSRSLREVLETEGGGGEDWILEVSSPGVERPLTKARDFERFAGSRVRVRGYGPLAGRSRELEGTLLGLLEGDGETIALEVDGERVKIPRESVAAARLVYSWGKGS